MIKRNNTFYSQRGDPMNTIRLVVLFAFLVHWLSPTTLYAQTPQAVNAAWGNLAVVSNSGVQVLNLGSGNLTPPVAAALPYNLTWSPDGAQLLFADLVDDEGFNDLVLMNADGSNVRRFSDVVDSPIDVDAHVTPHWSADGSKIAFLDADVDSGGSTIQIVTPDFQQRQLLYSFVGFADGFDWSPDGKTFALGREVNSSLELFLAPANGSGMQRITNGADVGPIRWSPDGTQLAVVERVGTGGARDIYLRDAQGGNRQRLTFNGGTDPQWSPDGSNIVYVAPGVGGAWDLYLINVNTGLLTNLTNSSQDELSPLWSPDGEWVAFGAGNSNSGFEITRIDVNGANRTPLGIGGFPGDWQPRPNVLSNPGFEVGAMYWRFNTNGQSAFTIVSPGQVGNQAAKVTVTKRSSTIQLFQKGVRLEPNTRYRLRFAAYSNTARDLSVYLQNHDTGVSYGLSNFKVNLTKQWKTFTIDFTTKNITQIVANGRLRFWFGPFARNGDNYFIDAVSLQKLPATTAATTSAGVASLSGQVHGALNAAGPLTVQLVDLASEGAAFQSLAQPDANGAFRFDGIPYGVYEVRLLNPSGEQALEPVQLLLDEEPQEELIFAPAEIDHQLFLPLISQ
jgi:Tol biopolymer transport system component